MTAAPFRVFVGWDAREDIAYRVCRSSLLARASIPVQVMPLRQADLRDRGLYDRPPDPLAATEFTYTRFLVPHLAGYEGWALYCDCDFLWLEDVAKLASLADHRYGAMCVHHDHRPTETTKMDGRPQTVFPRKNWSSLILYNCGHPATRRLTPSVANRETGAFLHRFQWLRDEEIGALAEGWNWLEGWSPKPSTGLPMAIHYTRGGPWFDAWRNVDYADLWMEEERRLEVLEPEN